MTISRETGSSIEHAQFQTAEVVLTDCLPRAKAQDIQKRLLGLCCSGHTAGSLASVGNANKTCDFRFRTVACSHMAPSGTIDTVLTGSSEFVAPGRSAQTV